VNKTTLVPSEAAIAAALQATNFLPEIEVQRRARLLHQDLIRLQIEGFRLLPVQMYPGSATRPEIRVSEYEFGPVRFGLENAHDPASVRKTVEEMAGTAISREDILYLSQICTLAHRIIPRSWMTDHKLMENVRLPSQHLDTLNEIWWLGRWSGVDEKLLQREACILPRPGKTIDWQFQLVVGNATWTINLEVKRIISSMGARAYRKTHYFYSTLRADGSIKTDNPQLKFRRSLDHEVNALAVTWFDEISVEFEAEVQRFVDEDDRIDVVTVWAPGDRGRGGWIRFFPRFRDIPAKRQVASSLLLEPDEEDQARIIAFWFPRTLASIQEEVNAL
jgi:hypothetical protein